MEVVQPLSGGLPKEQKAQPVSNKVSFCWEKGRKVTNSKNTEWTEFLLRWTVKRRNDF